MAGRPRPAIPPPTNLGAAIIRTVKTAPVGAPAEASNRVSLGLSNRLLARPEIGALVAAVVIFIFFLIVAPAFRSAPSFFTVLYQSSTIGLVAVAVGMLMIGGEFDLSAGVLVTAAGLCNALICYNLGLNLWVGALLSLIVCLAIGFFNGFMVMRTGIPSSSSRSARSSCCRAPTWASPRP